MKKIGIYPGSFKPPQKGHYDILEKMINDGMDEIYILISNKPRYLSDIIQKRDLASKELIKSALKRLIKTNKNKLEKIETKKNIMEFIKNHDGELGKVTAKQSKEIWQIYIKDDKEKINIKISEDISPIISTMRLIQNILKNKKEKTKIYLYKSDKNKENKRFDDISKRYKKDVILKNIPIIYEINATSFRKKILEKGFELEEKNIKEYIPDNLEKKDIKKIINILHFIK